VQKVLGEVGPNTRGVQRMLERLGFSYVERIDPFDGGPHFEANWRDLTLVRRYRSVKLSEDDFELQGDDVARGLRALSGRSFRDPHPGGWMTSRLPPPPQGAFFFPIYSTQTNILYYSISPFFHPSHFLFHSHNSPSFHHFIFFLFLPLLIYYFITPLFSSSSLPLYSSVFTTSLSPLPPILFYYLLLNFLPPISIFLPSLFPNSLSI
jgi:hypothetical protein